MFLPLLPRPLSLEVWERDSLGTGCAQQSRVRMRRGSEALGRAALGKELDGLMGGEGRGGATEGCSALATPSQPPAQIPHSRSVRRMSLGWGLDDSAGRRGMGRETTGSWSRPGHSQTAPSPGSRRLSPALSPGLEGPAQVQMLPLVAILGRKLHCPKSTTSLACPKLTPLVSTTHWGLGVNTRKMLKMTPPPSSALTLRQALS